MTQFQAPSRIRKSALRLLAALTITLGCVAAPLAGAAHAGGLSGGVVLRSGSGFSNFETAGRMPGVGAGCHPACAASHDQGIDTAGSKPSVAAGSN